MEIEIKIRFRPEISNYNVVSISLTAYPAKCGENDTILNTKAASNYNKCVADRYTLHICTGIIYEIGQNKNHYNTEWNPRNRANN